MATKQLVTNRTSLKGTIQVPGDKSISHRAVMLGSIAEGRTTIRNFLEGDDCLSTISCFRKLGVEIEQKGSDVIISGKGEAGLKEPEEILDVGNSGTTLRLMTGLLSGFPFHSILTGDASIAKRPMTRVAVPLRLMGAEIDGRNDGKFTPIAVRGSVPQSITYELPVASAQVKSAILLAGLRGNGKTTVIEKAETRDHTETMLRMFGVEVGKRGNEISIEGGQKLKGTPIMVPGDISSAAFFLAAGLLVPGSSVLLKDVGLNPTRTGILDVLKNMGADVEIMGHHMDAAEPYGDILVSASDLHATTIDGAIIPRLIDELPIIALMATQAAGTTVIADAKELKVKETNRIDTVVSELTKMGADITATEDGMIIRGKTPLRGAGVDSHGDHRIGMMLAVAALLAEGNAELMNADAVTVSYPTFFEHLQSLMV